MMSISTLLQSWVRGRKLNKIVMREYNMLPRDGKDGKSLHRRKLVDGKKDHTRVQPIEKKLERRI